MTNPKKPNLPNFEGWYATRSLSDDRKKSIKQLMSEAYNAGVADPYKANTLAQAPKVEIHIALECEAFGSPRASMYFNNRFIQRSYAQTVEVDANEMCKSLIDAGVDASIVWHA